MNYRIRSAAYLQGAKVASIMKAAQRPKQVEVVRHLTNRHEAMMELGCNVYVLSTSTFPRLGVPKDIFFGEAYRGGQVRGRFQVNNACHNVYGQPEKTGEIPFWDAPTSASNKFSLKRIFSWTDTLHIGTALADSLSECRGLKRAGEKFLTAIARAARGTDYNKQKGSRLVREAYQEILKPESREAYAAAESAFGCGEKYTELIRSTSVTNKDRGGELAGWVEHPMGIFVPTARSVPKAERDEVERETLGTYRQFVSSADPAILTKEQGEAFVEHVASNESSASKNSSSVSSSSGEASPSAVTPSSP